ncbi:MAG: RNA-binding protein [Armatimonadota bacterium]
MEEEELRVRGEVVLLQAALKLAQAVYTGGEVKQFLAEEEVEVNGERETRRGRQLRNNDVIGLPDGRRIRILTEA